MSAKPLAVGATKLKGNGNILFYFNLPILYHATGGVLNVSKSAVTPVAVAL